MTYELTPVDFPVHGLADWTGPRWLEGLQGRSGGSPMEVWLAHGLTLEPGAGPWAWVLSIPTLHVDAYPQDPMRTLMWTVALHLVLLTDPEVDQEALDVVDSWVDDAEAWSPAVWTVDGRSVGALTTHRGDAWAGVVVDGLRDADRGLVGVVARGVDSATVSLSRVVDAAPYGFDLAAPVGLAEVARSMSAVWGEPPPDEE